MDYPNIRQTDICPLCRGRKDRGLVACWPCYRKHDMRHGDSIAVESTLKAAEGALSIGGVVIEPCDCKGGNGLHSMLCAARG